MPDFPSIVIIGGGITGLACALRLRDLALARRPPRARLTLVEAEPRLGGKLVSHRVGEFVVDAGADIFVASKPGGLELCAALGITDRVIETDNNRRRTFVREGTHLIPASHYGTERLATLRGGMQELVDYAARAVTEVETVTASAVEAIEYRQDSMRYDVRCAGHSFSAGAVVIAVPARAAAAMVRSIAPEASALLAATSYRSLFTVSAGYPARDVPHSLDGFGYMVPDAAAGAVSACTWTSSKIPSRAPASHTLLRGYVHGAPGLSTADAREFVLEEFRQVLGISAAPLFTLEHAWHDALPVPRRDPAAAARAVRAALAGLGGLSIAGGAVDGAGIPDSIRSGQAAAEHAWRHCMTIPAHQKVLIP